MPGNWSISALRIRNCYRSNVSFPCIAQCFSVRVIFWCREISFDEFCHNQTRSPEKEKMSAGTRQGKCFLSLILPVCQSQWNDSKVEDEFILIEDATNSQPLCSLLLLQYEIIGQLNENYLLVLIRIRS